MYTFHVGERVRWRRDLEGALAERVAEFRKRYGDEVTINQVWRVKPEEREYAGHTHDLLIKSDRCYEGHFSGMWFEPVRSRTPTS